jgi:hypothetical protein
VKKARTVSFYRTTNAMPDALSRMPAADIPGASSPHRRSHPSTSLTCFCPDAPHEAYLSEKANLSHLRAFGSVITSRVYGDQPAKLDRHSFHGVFLGYTASDLNVRYYDTTSGRIKTARHVVFDEAQYMSSKRPPRPQFLYDLGLENPSDPDHLSEAVPARTAPPAAHGSLFTGTSASHSPYDPAPVDPPGWC